MFNWAKQTLGVTDSNHGPEALQSVAQQTKDTPYTELKKDDLKWEIPESTCVETKTFYMISDNGHLGLAQIIYSNVMNIRTTAQFSSKIISPDPNQPHIWSSDNISNFSFSEDKHNFKAAGCTMDISEDGKSYSIKSTVNKQGIVDLKFTQTAPGFVVGKDGTSYFGIDPQNPWGKMYHKFWPTCQVEGHILTKSGPVDFKGRGLFIHALQGMKPHFAAAKWNFVNFQSPNYSAIMMEYTTPPSYGETVVTVGGIVKGDKILFTGASPSTNVKHTEVKGDPENDWPEPSAVAFTWEGNTSDGKDFKAVLEGSLGQRTDRVDVMGEVPKWVKQIVAGAAGTKPYIYQYTPKLKLKVNVGGEVVEEEGQLFMESTFIL